MLNKKGMNLRDLYESLGAEKLYLRLMDLMESKDDKPPRLQPDDFSIKEIWEQVGTKDFPIITGAIFSKRLIDAYKSQPTIGDKLVHVVPSAAMEEKIVGFTALEQLKPVEQGHEYESSHFEEKDVKIENHKYGRKLEITEELVKMDKTGQVLAAASDFGRKAAIFKEKLIMDVVRDVNSTAYNGGVLYKTDADYGNFDSTAFGTDGSGLKAVKLLLVKMTDENGDPILIGEKTLLVPDELTKNAYDLINPKLTESTYFKGYISDVLTSPFMTDAAEYFYGDFKSQFRYQEVYPIEVLRAKEGHADLFNKDLFAIFKVRMMGGCGAIDTKYVIRSEG